MKPIHKMKVIQIEITNACIHSCSNCTRFCGHHKKPFFMDIPTFKKAVDSMDGFPGMVGIMGGEPTLHPQFEELLKYYSSRIEPGKKYLNAIKPIKNFSRHLIENDMRNIKNRRGLWSSLGGGYYKHFELIQELFPFQLINDHSHSGLHQTLLIARKELGIPDDKWIEMRDNCWAQNLWSASITPKGCFFCEVAAALDMLFDGPGGWPIEKGWWKRRPEDFGEQLEWCEYCSATLNVPRIEAGLETDIVSPMLCEKLKSLGSPKIKKGKFKIFDISAYDKSRPGSEYSSEWYLPSGDNTRRVNSTNRSLYPKKLEAVIAVSDARAFAKNWKANVPHFDKAAIADFTGSVRETDISGPGNAAILNLKGKDMTEGLDAALEKLELADWIIFLDGDVMLAPDFRKTFFDWIFNPGCLYRCGLRENSSDAGSEVSWDDGKLAIGTGSGKHLLPFLFALANKNASSIRGRKASAFLFGGWPDEKNVLLEKLKDDGTAAKLEQLSKDEKRKTIQMTGHILKLWEKLVSREKRVALFGAGSHSKWFIQKLLEHGLPLPEIIFDDDPDTDSISGVPVANTEKRAACDIKTILVSSDTYAIEMTARARQLWNDGQATVINPYSGFPSPHFQK